MQLLIFLVILFGMFGTILTQYISQYRGAYKLWIETCVYEDGKLEGEDKKNLCSDIEAYSRELCEMNDLLIIVIYLIFITTFIISICFSIDLFLIDYSDVGYKSIILEHIASVILSIVVLIAIPVILHLLKISYVAVKVIRCFKVDKLLMKINRWDEQKYLELTTIDDKLFDLWWEHQCHCLKKRKRPHPHALYKKLQTKIENGQITKCPEWIEKEYPEWIKEAKSRKVRCK